jgi:hypothetical protein
MAKQAYVYSGTDWVPLASEVTNLSGYQTKASNQFANRNLVINGDMQIAQRGTSLTGQTTLNGYPCIDRFAFYQTGAGTLTINQENDAPTGSGFRRSLRVLATTGNNSLGAGAELLMIHRMEGQNLQHIKKGTAAAEQLTLSFWVKSNVTGTYVIALQDVDNDRYIARTYTINASATWEREVITFPADTTGAFDNDNANSFQVLMWLAAGSNSTSGTLATNWASTVTANRAVGQTNMVATTNNYWQVTGVQLEVGDTATPFEFKSVEDELLECQRYYEKTYNLETALGTGVAPGWVGAVTSSATTETGGSAFKVVKRGTPTITLYNAISGASGAVYRVSDAASVSSSVNYIGNNGFGLINVSSNNSFYYHYVANAEL